MQRTLGSILHDQPPIRMTKGCQKQCCERARGEGRGRVVHWATVLSGVSSSKQQATSNFSSTANKAGWSTARLGCTCFKTYEQLLPVRGRVVQQPSCRGTLCQRLGDTSSRGTIPGIRDLYHWLTGIYERGYALRTTAGVSNAALHRPPSLLPETGRLEHAP